MDNLSFSKISYNLLAIEVHALFESHSGCIQQFSLRCFNVCLFFGSKFRRVFVNTQYGLLSFVCLCRFVRKYRKRTSIIFSSEPKRRAWNVRGLRVGNHDNEVITKIRNARMFRVYFLKKCQR